MKVALITTVRHNVGDDFVRHGILHLLASATDGVLDEWPIHKHFPLTVRPEWEWLHTSGVTHWLDRVPGVRALGCSRLLDRLPLRHGTDRILGADLVVQSGAPVYWFNEGSDSSRNEWYEPLIRRRWELVRARVPLLNLGAGTCQAFHSNGEEFHGAEATLAFVREFHACCVVTTVRDELSRKVLRLAGVDAPLLPCPSLFARQRLRVEPGAGDYVALNFMPSGGHYRLDRRIDPAAWRTAFTAFARELARHERCLLVCHDQAEWAAAGELLPEVERFRAREAVDYLRVYARARCGVLNRVHGAFALASFGRPSVIVGNDSRSRMAGLIGLPCRYVGEMSAGNLRAAFEELNALAGDYGDIVSRIMREGEEAYLRLLRPAVSVTKEGGHA